MPIIHKKSNSHGANGVSPSPVSKGGSASQPRRELKSSSQVVEFTQGYPKGLLGDIARYLAEYIALPRQQVVVTTAWVMAAWLAELWDRFPHLAITSPERRCGKTRFLQLLEHVTPRPCNTTNISPAALYRMVEQEQPTLLLDESQSIARRGSEASEVLREILNAGIDRDAVIIRCGGKNMNELQRFRVYSPKVIALIGALDSVLADRCLAIQMKRKTKGDAVVSYRSRVVKDKATPLAKRLAAWSKKNKQRIANTYDTIDTFHIENDRMAELLLPLQSVLQVGCPELLPELEAYAYHLEAEEARVENESPGVLLLSAIRDILGEKSFMTTVQLIDCLIARNEEPWHRWNRGGALNAESLSRLLKPYGIRPYRKQKRLVGKVKTMRGYRTSDFVEAWERYLPTPPQT